MCFFFNCFILVPRRPTLSTLSNCTCNLYVYTCINTTTATAVYKDVRMSAWGSANAATGATGASAWADEVDEATNGTLHNMPSTPRRPRVAVQRPQRSATD